MVKIEWKLMVSQHSIYARESSLNSKRFSRSGLKYLQQNFHSQSIVCKVEHRKERIQLNNISFAQYTFWQKEKDEPLMPASGQAFLSGRNFTEFWQVSGDLIKETRAREMMTTDEQAHSIGRLILDAYFLPYIYLNLLSIPR